MTQTPSSSKKSGTAPQTSAAPAAAGASSYNKLKDFSVESQRRMFIQEQERERQAAEFRKSSRKILKASLSGSASGASSSIVISGLMSQLESGKSGFEPKTRVGDDDDDSIADDWSLDSEESFYVGIERADYTQPNNAEMYGRGDSEREVKEDCLGISRVSASLLDSEITVDPSEIFIRDHSFIADNSMKDVLVTKPIDVIGLDYRGNMSFEENDSDAQVYQQEAAEGKMFINKLIADSEPGGIENVINFPSTTPAINQNVVGTPLTTPKTRTGGPKTSLPVTGHFPVLSPMTLFSPLATGGKGIEGEDNAMRQMRERQIRKEAADEANAALAEKLKEVEFLFASGRGNIDATEFAEKLGRILR
ncbi:hypothetical protein ACHAXS_011625 [Conticribra weissflogii]